jgi:thiol:disulfide interchange protein DsbD
MRRAGIGTLLALTAGWAGAQQHASWSVAADPATAAPGGATLARVTAEIDPGWHLYSASSPAGIPATFQVTSVSGLVEMRGVYQPPPKRAFDPNFNSPTETYEGQVSFLLVVDMAKTAPAGPAEFTVAVRYQTCNDVQCVPGRWSGKASVTIDPHLRTTGVIVGGNYVKVKPPSASQAGSTGQGLTLFLLTAFGFGLASLFTPCVFPMIPITMSYFLNRPSGGRRDAVMQAVVFCLGIIVLFSGIGLAVAAILGPVGVVQLGGSPWVNGFIAALFMAFGLSLLGAFEITVPSSIVTRLNRGADKGGFVGTLLMGLTFSLASFACVGPFVGTLLAASVAGGGLRPLLGMVVFAAGLALPFFLLALFPSYLKKLPRSGGWMARVKVVMGFVILAASLKYLSAVDQSLAWGWLTRERFLAAWIVLFAMAGMYLLGFVRLEGIKPDEPMRLGRLLVGMAFLVFAISLFPGMLGGRLGDLDSYVPAASATGAPGASQNSGLTWLKDDYQAALDQARREGKLVFINFTGVACANCHWMEANMLPIPAVAAVLKNFVLVELYTDRTDAVSERNAKLEETRFQTVATPFYAIVRPDESVVATFAGRTADVPTFVAFLNRGIAAPPPAVTSAPAGDVPPLTTLDGRPFESAGKVAVLDFWATYCVPCIREIPMFDRLNQELGPKGVAVVGIAMDEEGAEIVKPFLAKHPMEYPVALGSAALAKQFATEDGLPVTLVFDRSGKLIKRFTGLTKEDELRAAVNGAM